MIRLRSGGFSKGTKSKIMDAVDIFLKDQTAYIHYSSSDIEMIGVNYKKYVKSIIDGEIKDNKLFVAYDDFQNRVAGFQIASFDENGEGHIHGMFVDENYRGKRRELGEKSIADCLNQRAEKWLKNKGVGKVRLSVYRENDIGKRYWSKNGYRVEKSKSFIHLMHRVLNSARGRKTSNLKPLSKVI